MSNFAELARPQEPAIATDFFRAFEPVVTQCLSLSDTSAEALRIERARRGALESVVGLSFAPGQEQPLRQGIATYDMMPKRLGIFARSNESPDSIEPRLLRAVFDNNSDKTPRSLWLDFILRRDGSPFMFSEELAAYDALNPMFWDSYQFHAKPGEHAVSSESHKHRVKMAACALTELYLLTKDKLPKGHHNQLDEFDFYQGRDRMYIRKVSARGCQILARSFTGLELKSAHVSHGIE